MSLRRSSLTSLVFLRMVRVHSALAVAILACGSGAMASESFFSPERRGELSRRWAFETGVAFITDRNIDQLKRGELNVSSGDAGGQIYHFTAAYLLHEFEWETDRSVFRPQVELPLTLGIVDENARSPFLDYNAAVAVRWVDFPWNEHLYTTFATGVGFSYSQKVLAMDRKRHPNDERSHTKFNWPIQLTLASPESRHHQIVLFLAHQSGGHFFDRGGVNSLGLGYRFGFE